MKAQRREAAHRQQLLTTGLWSDLTLVVQGQAYELHRALVAPKCPYIWSYLSPSWPKKHAVPGNPSPNAFLFDLPPLLFDFSADLTLFWALVYKDELEWQEYWFETGAFLLSQAQMLQFWRLHRISVFLGFDRLSDQIKELLCGQNLDHLTCAPLHHDERVLYLAALLQACLDSLEDYSSWVFCLCAWAKAVLNCPDFMDSDALKPNCTTALDSTSIVLSICPCCLQSAGDHPVPDSQWTIVTVPERRTNRPCLAHIGPLKASLGLIYETLDPLDGLKQYSLTMEANSFYPVADLPSFGEKPLFKGHCQVCLSTKIPVYIAFIKSL